MSSEPNLNTPPHATQADVLYQELCRVRRAALLLLDRVERTPSARVGWEIASWPEWESLRREAGGS